MTRLSLPTGVRGSVFQAAHLCVRRDSTGVRLRGINCVKSLCISTPKYLKCETLCKGASAGIEASSGCSAKITDLPQLMQMPEYLPKVLMSDKATPKESEVFWERIGIFFLGQILSGYR